MKHKRQWSTVFSQCSTLSTDAPWKKIFDNMLHDVFPLGITLRKDTLSSDIKGMEWTYTLDTKKPIPQIMDELTSRLDTVIQSSMVIHNTKSTVVSDVDVPPNNDNVLDDPDNVSSWTQVKRKIIRDTLLERYVLEKGKVFSLSPMRMRRFLSFLIIGLMFKTICSHHIEYRKGYIQHIDGFQFHQDQIILTKNIYGTISSPQTMTTIEPIRPSVSSLSDSWVQYLSDVHNPCL